MPKSSPLAKRNRQTGFFKVGYKNNNIYEGELKHGRRSGKGKMIYSDGTVIYGTWKNDKLAPDSLCNITRPRDFIFDGKTNCSGIGFIGKKVNFSGSIYSGNFSKNIQNTPTETPFDGKISIVGTDIEQIEGYIIRGITTGMTEGRKCRMSYRDGWQYNGDIIKVQDTFKRHGFGTYSRFMSDEKYTGNWVNDKRHGKGTSILCDDSSYEGEWINDKKHGFGKLVFRNTIYEGEFVDGILTGKGTLTYENGDKYEYLGTDKIIVDDKEIDVIRGVITYVNGNVYEGQLIKDMFSFDFLRNYHGTMKYANGDKYIGNWLNGYKNGYGTYAYANGDTYNASWTRGRKNGLGSYIYFNLEWNGKIETSSFDSRTYYRRGIERCIITKETANYIKKTISDFEQEIDFDDHPNKQNTNKKEFCIYLDKLTEKRFFQILYCDKLIFSSEIHTRHDDIEIFMFIRDMDSLELYNKNDLTEEEIEEITCPISYNYMINPITLSCGHTFDEKNVNKLIYENDQKQNCPLCRRQIVNYYVNDNIIRILNKCRFTCNGIVMETFLFHFLKKINGTDLLNFKKYDENAWLRDVIFND